MNTRRIFALLAVVMPLVGCTDTQLSWWGDSGRDEQRAVLVVVLDNAADRHGVDPRLMVALAECESHLRVDAHNPSGASGLLQFMPSTFAAHAEQSGWTADDLWNPDAQADVAGKMIADGQLGAWSCAPAARAAVR